MKSSKLLLFVVVLVLLVCPQLQAQTSTINFYVNATTGVDAKNNGSSESKPLKTIGYALERVRATRANPENEAIINIAAGTYNESITVDLNNIWLKGAGPDLTFLLGNGTSTLLQITGPVRSRITGFAIKNGGEGLYSSFASVEVEDCLIADNAGFAGIDVLNSGLMTLKNTNVRNNNVGIALSRNAAVIMNSCNVFENSGNGIEVYWSSSARVISSAVYSNNRDGINVGAGSNLRLLSSAIHDNNGQGVFIWNNGSLVMLSGEVKNNQGHGISLQLGASGYIESGSSITGNTGFGINCWNGSVASIITGDISGNTLGVTNCF